MTSPITPDIITLSRRLDTCRDGRVRLIVGEHDAILEGIAARDPERAGAAMAAHMRLSQRQYRSIQ